jgi:hypothetical protein
MKVIGNGPTLEALQEEMMPARGARFKVRRADERWEKGTPFNISAHC